MSSWINVRSKKKNTKRSSVLLLGILFFGTDVNCSKFLDVRNLQEQVKKAFCYQKLFWPFPVWLNCSSGLKNFENSRPSTSNFKRFSCSLETRIFFHRWSEQFWKQNTFHILHLYKLSDFLQEMSWNGERRLKMS